jgi:hypothetical protein
MDIHNVDNCCNCGYPQFPQLLISTIHIVDIHNSNCGYPQSNYCGYPQCGLNVNFAPHRRRISDEKFTAKLRSIVIKTFGLKHRIAMDIKTKNDISVENCYTWISIYHNSSSIVGYPVVQ